MSIVVERAGEGDPYRTRFLCGQLVQSTTSAAPRRTTSSRATVHPPQIGERVGAAPDDARELFERVVSSAVEWELESLRASLVNRKTPDASKGGAVDDAGTIRTDIEESTRVVFELLASDQSNRRNADLCEIQREQLSAFGPFDVSVVGHPRAGKVLLDDVEEYTPVAQRSDPIAGLEDDVRDAGRPGRTTWICPRVSTTRRATRHPTVPVSESQAAFASKYNSARPSMLKSGKSPVCSATSVARAASSTGQ